MTEPAPATGSLFDIRLQRLRHAGKRSSLYDDTPLSPLHRLAAKNFAERLADIHRTFPRALLTGYPAPAFKANKKIEDLIEMNLCPERTNFPVLAGKEELFPLGDKTLDLVLSLLTLHNIDDLPGALIQILRSLKPEGVFLGVLFGGETLHELRDVLAETEMHLRNGMSPRIHPFADKQQMSNLLQRAGFGLPVVDSETVKMSHESLSGLVHDLRSMGETNILTDRDKRYPGKSFWPLAENLYKKRFPDPQSPENDRIIASFEMIYLIGWRH